MLVIFSDFVFLLPSASLLPWMCHIINVMGNIFLLEGKYMAFP